MLGKRQKEKSMDGMVVMAYIFAVAGITFGMAGVVALIRLEKITKTLKQKGILEGDSSVRDSDGNF